MRFRSKQYITKGVQAGIPFVLQMFLWGLIADLPEPIDYLQVFRLSNEDGKQKIIHEQEEPDYKREYILFTDTVIETKVFVIDDETHCTMLLAEEY